MGVDSVNSPVELHSPVAVPYWQNAIITKETDLRADIRVASSNALKRKMQCELTQVLKEEAVSQSIENLRGHYVGELQEKWKFPSDHLPVGATIDGFHMATWNVLNAEYMAWIELNSQGLARSLITQQHQYLADSKLTQRDLLVIEDVLKMVSHPTHPKSALGLQECSQAFLAELQTHLPPNMQIIYSSQNPVKDQNVFIYDTNLFNLISCDIPNDAFPCHPGRDLMNVVLEKKDTGVFYQFFNAHVPGDPNLPGRDEFASYVLAHRKEGAVVIGLGDMNFNPMQLSDAFRKAALARKEENLFINLANYYAHVGTDLYAKTIDHIFVERNRAKFATNSPNEVLNGLQEVVDLLQ